jgi:ornithine cyclodeaminase/alanine dehydrogenase-like protein (mu-crystallin family)
VVCLVAFGLPLKSTPTSYCSWPCTLPLPILLLSIALLMTILSSLCADHPAVHFNAIADDLRDQVKSAICQADCVLCDFFHHTSHSEWVHPGTHIILISSYEPEMRLTLHSYKCCLTVVRPDRGKLHHHLGLLSRDVEGGKLLMVYHFVKR